MDTRRYHGGEVGVGVGGVNTNNTKATVGILTVNVPTVIIPTINIPTKNTENNMRGTQATDKQNTPLARRSRKRGGGDL